MAESDDIRFDGVRVLLVDDEPNLLRVVRRILHRHGAEVESAGNGADALDALQDFPADIILTDLKMPELDGIGLLQRLRERDHDTIVIVLTGHGTMETAIEAMRLGARDYLIKPCDPDEILLVVQREIEAQRLRRENQRLRSEVTALTRRIEQAESYGEMIGDSLPMRQVYQQIDRLCRFHDMTVLLMGETGTGKELVARALHRGSPRAAKPFLAINCAAIPDDLQESQLFGHKRGAFTGATEDYVGAFEAADGGTLLLDEVGEMRHEMQAKLLRALEERTITPLGSHRTVDVDVRVVAATNRDLAQAVAEGDFRADLYNRLEGAIIRLPALRERREDIPGLAKAFLAKIAHDYAVEPKALTERAVARLSRHAWPGNVRELQNVIRRAFVFADGPALDAEDLDIAGAPTGAETALHPAAAPAFAEAEVGMLDGHERDLIQQALEQAGGNKSRAAEILGIDRKRLYRRIRKYGLN